MRKKIILLGRIFLSLFLILWNVILNNIIPHSRQKFWSYESFDRHTEWATFPKCLPSSAHDLSYYVYEGYFSDVCGYHVVFSEEDYASIKEDRTEHYQTAVENGHGYCYKDGKKAYHMFH